MWTFFRDGGGVYKRAHFPASNQPASNPNPWSDVQKHPPSYHHVFCKAECCWLFYPCVPLTVQFITWRGLGVCVCSPMTFSKSTCGVFRARNAEISAFTIHHSLTLVLLPFKERYHSSELHLITAMNSDKLHITFHKSFPIQCPLSPCLPRSPTPLPAPCLSGWLHGWAPASWESIFGDQNQFTWFILHQIGFEVYIV